MKWLRSLRYIVAILCGLLALYTGYLRIFGYSINDTINTGDYYMRSDNGGSNYQVETWVSTFNGTYTVSGLVVTPDSGVYCNWHFWYVNNVLSYSSSCTAGSIVFGGSSNRYSNVPELNMQGIPDLQVRVNQSDDFMLLKKKVEDLLDAQRAWWFQTVGSISSAVVSIIMCGCVLRIVHGNYSSGNI